MELVDLMMREIRSASAAVVSFLYDEVLRCYIALRTDVVQMASAGESHALCPSVLRNFGDNLQRAIEAQLFDFEPVNSVFGAALAPVEVSVVGPQRSKDQTNDSHGVFSL